MVKDVVEGVKLVSSTIQNIRNIYSTVNDGYQYMNTNYPEIKNDLVIMCSELKKTCNAVAKASEIITHFRFNISPVTIHGEPTRFNDYFIKYKMDSGEAKNRIRSLKGSCSIITKHAQKIQKDATTKFNKNNFLELFGLYSIERARQVEQALSNIYNEEKEWYIIVDVLSESLKMAINDVSDHLETNGMMHSDNIKIAAPLLKKYSALFEQLEKESNQQAQAIQDLMDTLV